MARKGNFKVFEGHSWYVPGVADIFILLLWLLAGALVGNIITFIFAMVLGPEAGQECGMVVAYPVMFIPAIIYVGVKSRNLSMIRSGFKFDSNNFKPLGGFTAAVIAAVATLCLAFCVDAVTAVMPPMPKWLEDILKSMTGGNIWLDLLCVSIFAPLFEEWLCRGTVLRGLLGNGTKPVWAILISAIFFALIHANPWQAIPAFMLGCLFGYVYFKTGSIKLTMLMHCVNNTFAVIVSNIDSLADMETWRDVFPTAQYWLIFTACAILTVLSVLAFRKIALNSPKGNCDAVPSIFEQ